MEQKGFRYEFTGDENQTGRSTENEFFEIKMTGESETKPFVIFI